MTEIETPRQKKNKWALKKYATNEEYREAKILYQRNRYAEADVHEKAKEYQKLYALNNKEKLKAYSKAYREARKTVEVPKISPEDDVELMALYKLVCKI